MGTYIDVSIVMCDCGHAGKYSTVIIFCIWTLTTSYSFLTDAELVILARIQPILSKFVLQINRIISLIHFLNPKALSIKHCYAMATTRWKVTSEIIS